MPTGLLRALSSLVVATLIAGACSSDTTVTETVEDSGIRETSGTDGNSSTTAVADDGEPATDESGSDDDPDRPSTPRST